MVNSSNEQDFVIRIPKNCMNDDFKDIDLTTEDPNNLSVQASLEITSDPITEETETEIVVRFRGRCKFL